MRKKKIYNKITKMNYNYKSYYIIKGKFANINQITKIVLLKTS